MSENVEKNAKCTCLRFPSADQAARGSLEPPEAMSFNPSCPQHGARAEIFDFPPPSFHEPAQSAPEASPAPEPIPPADPVAAFVEAVVAVDRRAFTSTAEIMSAAREWCAENGELTFGPRQLAAQLKRRRGVQPHSNGQRRGWRGVKLR